MSNGKGNFDKTQRPTEYPMDEGVPDIVIAVVGPPRSGKSTFIDLLGGANPTTGVGLQPHAGGIQLAGAFNLDGRRVILIDTPGVYHSKTGSDILKTVAAFLEILYGRSRTLAGILYFYRVDDIQTHGIFPHGIFPRDCRVFRDLCGESTLRNVVIVNNTWGNVDPQAIKVLEAELMKNTLKAAIDMGAQVARNENTITSTQNIIRLVLDNHLSSLRTRSLIQDATDPNVSEVAIAVMGALGVDKSTFINLLCGANLGSSTSTVKVAGPFDLDGRRVVLIDTPGFNDATQSDTDILSMLVAFSHKRGSTLAGVLYFHSILDIRGDSIPARNFKMFQELCGQSTLQNFVIITNGWGGWSDGAYALNEASMKKDIFFWLAINKGARFARNDNTITSAQNIIRLVLNNQPLPRIQSPDQNATVYHSIDNYSGGGEATRSPQDPDAPDVAIIVIGAIESGKSTFINLLSGANLGSHTSTVQVTDPFDLDGRHVTLIDTPGFGDTTRSDIDVLKEIAAFLATSYKRGRKLTGILYFHPISDFRMDWISTMNLKMFRELCGEGTLQNAVIVTNMWGEVDLQVGEAREAELMREDVFFKPILDKGARITRNENTITSAQNIIRLFFDNRPLPLRIQRELVDEHKDISATSASEELHREINAQNKKHREEVRNTRVLKEEIHVLKAEKRAMRDENEEIRRELQRVQREMETR